MPTKAHTHLHLFLKSWDPVVWDLPLHFYTVVQTCLLNIRGQKSRALMGHYKSWSKCSSISLEITKAWWWLVFCQRSHNSPVKTKVSQEAKIINWLNSSCHLHSCSKCWHHLVVRLANIQTLYSYPSRAKCVHITYQWARGNCSPLGSGPAADAFSKDPSASTSVLFYSFGARCVSRLE